MDPAMWIMWCIGHFKWVIEISVGQNFLLVTGHLLTGQCQNFVHLVTGHTPRRIDWNSTVLGEF